MIKVNNQEENIVEIEINYGNFELHSKGQIIKGISPTIDFCMEKKTLEIETRLTFDFLEKMEDNTKININKYITDINYEDQNGWLSLTTGEYKVDLEKKKEKYKITAFIEEKAEDVKIELEEEIEFKRK